MPPNTLDTMAPTSPTPERRCGKCQASPKQCSTCKFNAARKALRDTARETSVVAPRLIKIREQHKKNTREQRKSAKANGCTYGKPDQRKCKGPDGKTGNCEKFRKSACSPPGFSFCMACYRKAFPEGHEAFLASAKNRRAALATKTCVGQRNGKVCSKLFSDENGIAAALRRAGLTAPAALAAMQTPGILKFAVDAHHRSGMCLTCFLKAHPNHAKALKDHTQCTGHDDAGKRCQRTAQKRGLCAHHHARTLPCRDTGEPRTSKKRARTLPCRNSACTSGEPRVPRKGGLCQQCLDAFNLTVKEQAAKFTPVGRPGKRRRL